MQKKIEFQTKRRQKKVPTLTAIIAGILLLVTATSISILKLTVSKMNANMEQFLDTQLFTPNTILFFTLIIIGSLIVFPVPFSIPATENEQNNIHVEANTKSIRTFKPYDPIVATLTGIVLILDGLYMILITNILENRLGINIDMLSHIVIIFLGVFVLALGVYIILIKSTPIIYEVPFWNRFIILKTKRIKKDDVTYTRIEYVPKHEETVYQKTFYKTGTERYLFDMETNLTPGMLKLNGTYVLSHGRLKLIN